eukprot:362277-Chlamydomonas_euryale.AAC.2
MRQPQAHASTGGSRRRACNAAAAGAREHRGQPQARVQCSSCGRTRAQGAAAGARAMRQLQAHASTRGSCGRTRAQGAAAGAREHRGQLRARSYPPHTGCCEKEMKSQSHRDSGIGVWGKGGKGKRCGYGKDGAGERWGKGTRLGRGKDGAGERRVRGNTG